MRPPRIPSDRQEIVRVRGRARDLERRSPGPWHVVGGTGEPAFQNSWDAEGSGAVPPRFRWTLGAGLEIQGAFTGGTYGTVAFTLPEGYRPDYVMYLAGSDADNNPLTFKIDTTGDVTIYGGGVPDSAVTTGKIADGAVTAAKLEADATGNDGKWLRLSSGALVYDAIEAADVSIADAGGYFTGTDVESALQEIGAGGGGGGGGGGMVKLFDSTLATATATIDTGAGGIASGYSALLVVIFARSATASTGFEDLRIRFNNDSGANYSTVLDYGQRSSVFGSFAENGADHSICGFVPGASATANYFASIRLNIPSYDSTASFKTFDFSGGTMPADTTKSKTGNGVGTWASTAAISRLAIYAQSGSNLVVGSRVIIYGLP